MNFYGLGIDVAEVDRIRSSIDQFGESFLNRVFTAQEQEYCELRKKDKALNYAARFAAKEAVSKAFGTGIGKSIGWCEIEVQKKESGEPTIHLSGKALELANELGVAEVKISLTHTKHYAAANAVVLLKV